MTISGPPSNAFADPAQRRTPLFLPTPFRLNLQAAQDSPLPDEQAVPEIAALFPPEAGLMYCQSVIPYLKIFARQTGMATVLRNLTDIWEQDGFLPIDNLTSRMLKKTCPDLPEQAVHILHGQIRDHYRDPEPLTGYDRKQHAPLTIGLGHLCAVLTGQPVALVMMDDSNLGGLIQHLDKMIVVRDGRPPGQTGEGTEAYAMTDRILTVMAGVASDAFAVGMPENCRMHRARTGGDEQVFLTVGATRQELQARIDTRAVPEVERLMAGLGLTSHEHLKDRDDRVRAGSGKAFTVLMLDRDTRPGVDLIAADENLGQVKLEIGIGRRGRLSAGYFNSLNERAPPPDYERELKGRGVVDASQKLTENDTANLYRLEEANRHYEWAARQQETFNRLSRQNGTKYPRAPQALDYMRGENNPETGGIDWQDERRLAPYDHLSAPVAAGVLAAMNRVLEKPKYARYFHRPAPAAETARSENRTDLLFATPMELEALRFDHRVSRAGLQLKGEQREYCHDLLGSFSPRDHATGTLIKDVMPELFGRFMHDTGNLKAHLRSWPEALPGIKPEQMACYGFAASLGNLAGVNKLLGSDNANVVLRGFTRLVEGSFRECGVPPEYLELGHEGGGNLIGLVRPVVWHENKLSLVTERKLERAERVMAKRMARLKAQKIAPYLKRHGGTVPADLNPNLTFGDIADPKRNTKGITLTTLIMRLDPEDAQGRPVSGGLRRAELARLRDAKIDAQRAGNRASRNTPASIPG